MTGKGSVNHNSRKFHAKNTDPERSCLNVEYCNENIKDVYHELFDEALARYNEKQTRSDRRIDDYYEKICSGKQEKPFHEIILQIGNKDDMGAKTENGQLAAKILDEYMQDFQWRNPTLRVFSAHLHMDEATPHLHIDFIPYTTGSKRGLETRVSLKKALAELGFKGGTRSETERNQWVAAEKERLAEIMLKHDIEWEKKGTHEKHLSVLDFEKQERQKEVSYYAFLTLYWTGIRLGELLALSLADFDAEEKTLSITKSYQRINGRDVITEPKTAKGKRVITLPDFLVSELEEYVCKLYGMMADDRLFTITKSYLEKEMIRGTELSGIKKIRLHDLRHSHASLLISKLGAQPNLVADRLGHEKIQTTLSTYSHLYPNQSRDLADQLNGLVEESDEEEGDAGNAGET